MTGISAVHANVLDLIGNTPIVDVSNLSPNPNVRILAKLEMQNPFGSVKDRIAKSMIEDAEKDGRLLPGQTILEPSSGNTGIALAAIARLKGYPIKILLPESVSIERRQMLEIMGAEVILTPGAEGSNGAVRRAQQLSDEHPEWCFIYQYGNDANPRAHYEGTGPEIWRDVPEITHFVAGLGTSGTLMGTGRFLKEQNPEIQIVAVEPPLGERVEGLRNMDEGYIPPVFENWHGFELLDRKRVVRPRESLEWTRRLVNECGVFAGHLVGCGAGRGRQGRRRDRRGHDRVHRLRRRLEVPLDRRLHRRSRRGRSQRREDHLLLTVFQAARPPVGAVRSAERERGIDDPAPVVVDEDRVEVELMDLGVVRGELGDPDDEVGQLLGGDLVERCRRTRGRDQRLPHPTARPAPTCSPRRRSPPPAGRPVRH